MISLDLMKSSEVRVAGDHDQPNSVKFIVLRNATRFAHSYIRTYVPILCLYEKVAFSIFISCFTYLFTLFFP